MLGAMSFADVFFCGTLSLLIATLLFGCESAHERAIRQSCFWNDDIVITNCGDPDNVWVRSGFSFCVEHCEYCRVAVGLPNEGRGDECNQLKCAAYCAKRYSDECVGTYSVLCKAAVGEIQRNNGTCDVECSKATRLQAWKGGGLAFALAIVTAFSGLPSRSSLFVATIVVLMVSLQGCGPECVDQTPLIDNWEPDWDAFNKRAGCKDEYNFWFGNSCASDVPFLWAKKGTHESRQQKFRISRVENDESKCLEWGANNSFCRSWSVLEISCPEQDFGICTCHEVSEAETYCKAWQCIAKEASQNICEKQGSDKDKSVDCHPPGTSPFPMNSNVFASLASLDGTSNLSTLSQKDQLALLRQQDSVHYKYSGACIIGRDVKYAYQSPCDEWREVETELASCFCTKAGQSDRYCEEWTCEEKDVGLFSVLFSGMQSYTEAGLIQRAEIERYKCTAQTVTPEGHTRCIAWHGEIESWEEVEVTRCETCANDRMRGSRSCSKGVDWVCSEYELPRIRHVDNWWYRLGFAALHLSWMIPIVSTLCAFLNSNVDYEESIVSTLRVFFLYTALSALATLCIGTLLFCIAFLRWSADEGKWWHPQRELRGIILPLFGGWGVVVVFNLVWALLKKAPFCVPAGALAVPLVIVFGLMWSVGVVGIVPAILGAFILMAFFAICASLKTKN